MFSSALKSFTSNISSNYSIASAPTSTAGYWKIYDAKKRSGGKVVSVFVFDRRYLDPNGTAATSRTGGASLKRAHDEVVERLRKEAASLARLRHPSILELVEPVEETRSGGLMFATEPVTASLAGLLEEKDEQERAGGVGGRTSRYVVEDPDTGGRRRREIEIDELEVQKGLLQIGKGLEFLHESAGLVHANLTPDAIFVNAKSDWKLSGLGFSTPPDHASNGASPTLVLSEVLNYDARLPRTVQLNMDYASPDFVMDNNIGAAADMFSLGLIIIALYNSPHKTPLDSGFSTSQYKRILASPSTIPNQSNNYLSSRPLPRDITTSLLPRLITRRPAQRLNAREFQQVAYFDSILVSTIHFLESLPAKTPNEKQQFLRGLPRILPQFPKSVLEKKVLPALLEETKDYELLSLVFQNIFKLVELVPNGKRTFCEKVVPVLRDIFLHTGKGQKGQGRDSSKEAGLLIVLENMKIITANCTGKEFKDDILPLLFLSLESPTHTVQDAALQCLPPLLALLDFSTVKNELFPAIAHVFSKTSSMSIKIKAMEALTTICGGGQPDAAPGATPAQAGTSAILDKYTVQEKVVPLLKGIKTKEPAVMMAALSVFTQIAKVADIEFLASDSLPTLWHFALGPLLSLQQFQAFMTLIKSISTRIEQEQTRKLEGFSTNSRVSNNSGAQATVNGGGEDDFESLVTGRKHVANGSVDAPDGAWTDESRRPGSQQAASSRPTNTAPAQFSWSTPSAPAAPPQSRSSLVAAATAQSSRAVTPDVSMGSFTTLTPSSNINQSNNYIAQPLQPQTSSVAPSNWQQPPQSTMNKSSLDWSTASNPSNAWSSTTNSSNAFVPPQNTTKQQPMAAAPNPWASQTQPNLTNQFSAIKIAPPPVQGNSWDALKPQASYGIGPGAGPGTFGQMQKQGLDKYDSLL